jgi:hypothetical protein
VTKGVLEAMTCQDADDAIERLGALSFVDETSEGLRLHDAVQAAVSARLRALEPERFRELRSAAWHHLQNETRRAGASDLRRFTADLLEGLDALAVDQHPTVRGCHRTGATSPRAAGLPRLWLTPCRVGTQAA